MKKIFQLIGILLVVVSIVVVGIYLYKFDKDADNRSLIVASKNYRQYFDKSNRELDNCNKSRAIENAWNDTTVTYAEAQKELIDLNNSESDCYLKKGYEDLDMMENYQNELEKIDCENVHTPEKCIFLKDNYDKYINTNRELYNEAIPNYYTSRKDFVYCYISAEVNGTDSSTCEDVEDFISKTLTEDVTKLNETMREYTKYYASL